MKQSDKLNKHKANVYQNTFQNLMIKRQNELTEKRFDKQLEIADRQFSFNAEAASFYGV